MTLSGIWELKKMALRNLARHKAKTILSSAAIMVSVAMFIFLNSFLGGMAIESRRNIVNYELGAAKLQTKLYFEKKDDMPSYENFTGWENYRDALDREGYYSAPRYVFSGTLFSTSGSAPILFNAVEPAAEAQVLRYARYVDFGRYVRNGQFEIALGTVAAEKLQVGIPARPLRHELEDLVSAVSNGTTAGSAAGSADAEFIRSLYEPAPPPKGLFAVKEKTAAGNERMILKKNVSGKDLERYWNLTASSGRNNVRISAVIDIKAVPETIRRDKWEGELMPALRDEDRNLVKAAYEYADFMDAYLLAEKDGGKLQQVLSAMIRADYSGAVRHVNQLVDAVVVGVINSPDPLPNGNTAYIPLDVLQGEDGMMLEGAVTELLIREKNVPDTRLPGKSESAVSIGAALERGLAAKGLSLSNELAVHTWLEYIQDYLGYEAIQRGVPQILIALLFILSFLGVSNTVLLAILERTKEIGMMRALGMNDNQMIVTYMLEAGFLGFIGSVLGIILGCCINYPVVKYGFDFSSMMDTMSQGIGFRVTSNFKSMWDIPVIIVSGIAATLLASFMAIIPTRRALKMPITESLRFE